MEFFGVGIAALIGLCGYLLNDVLNQANIDVASYMLDNAAFDPDDDNRAAMVLSSWYPRTCYLHILSRRRWIEIWS